MNRRHGHTRRPARARRGFIKALLAAGLSGAIFANTQACDGLQVEAPWVREPPPGAGAVAVFMSLRNTGTGPVEIDSVSAEGYGMGMLHETVRAGDKVGMRHLHAVTVPPGSKVTLAPGGMHIMLMHPATPARAGDSLALTLACGGHAVRVSAPVRRDPP
jgi:copper(I)-binding protein